MPSVLSHELGSTPGRPNRYDRRRAPAIRHIGCSLRGQRRRNEQVVPGSSADKGQPAEVSNTNQPAPNGTVRKRLRTDKLDAAQQARQR